MEERHAEMMEQRRKRYEDLRERAASVGLQLPDAPPWEETAMSPPDMPTPPEMPTPPPIPTPPEMPTPPGMPAAPERHDAARSGMTAGGRDAMREERYKAMRESASKSGVELPETPPWKLMTEEERKARWEKMRSMTPGERAAMREQHWAEMRERAAEKGVELPETPPWRRAQQRREEMRAKWESYRQIVEQMTDEQREAAAAVFSRPQTPPAQGMPPKMSLQPPYGREFGAMQPIPNRMPRPPMMPGYGAPAPWTGGDEDMMQLPPPPSTGYNRGW
jgi:hypothetical protein